MVASSEVCRSQGFSGLADKADGLLLQALSRAGNLDQLGVNKSDCVFI